MKLRMSKLNLVNESVEIVLIINRRKDIVNIINIQVGTFGSLNFPESCLSRKMENTNRKKTDFEIPAQRDESVQRIGIFW